MEQLSICVDVPELSIHAFQVMEEFWKSRQNNKDIMALDKVHVWVVHMYIRTYICTCITVVHIVEALIGVSNDGKWY